MKKNTLIGIDIGNCELKFAVCKNGMADFYAVQLPEDMVSDGRIRMLNSMKDFLKETRKELRLPKADCALVLPDQLVFCRRINMPYVREQQLVLNLPYEFHDYIPQETEKYYFDYAVDEIVYDEDGNPSSLNIMAAAVQKQLVDEYMELFSASGFKLRKILPREMAYIAVLRRYQQEEFPEAWAAKLQQAAAAAKSKNKLRDKADSRNKDQDNAAAGTAPGKKAGSDFQVSQDGLQAQPKAQADGGKSGRFGSRLKDKLSGKGKAAGSAGPSAAGDQAGGADGILVDEAAAARASVMDASFREASFTGTAVKEASFNKEAADKAAVLPEKVAGAGSAAEYRTAAPQAVPDELPGSVTVDINGIPLEAGSAFLHNDLNGDSSPDSASELNRDSNMAAGLGLEEDLTIDLQSEPSDMASQPQTGAQGQAPEQSQTLNLEQIKAREQMRSLNQTQTQAAVQHSGLPDTAEALGREYCFVDIGHQNTRLHFFCGTTLVNSRSIDYGCHEIDLAIANEMNVDEYVASSYKPVNYMNILDSTVCREAYTQLSVEIMKAINFYRFNNRDNNLSDIYFLGGGAMIPALREAVAEAAGLEMHLFSELFWSTNDDKALQAAVAYGVVLE